MKQGINRRDFFKVAATSGTTVAVASCTPDPVENLISKLVPPDDIVPGVAYHFATLCQECPSQCGVVVKTREGRAIKIEGNPKHSLNEGGLCAVGQASLQGLYNPNRAKGVTKNGKGTTWDIATQEIATKIKELVSQGKGDRILYIGTPNSGTFKTLISDFLKEIKGKQISFDMNPNQSILRANELVFGKREIPQYKIEEADLLVSFGADFLETWLNTLENTRGYTKMHAYKSGKKGKYIHVSSHLSLTGTNADEWISCPVGGETQIALALAHYLLPFSSYKSDADLIAYLKEYTPKQVSSNLKISVKHILQLAQQFGVTGKSLAIAGGNTTTNSENTSLQIAVNLLNAIGGSINKSVVFGSNYQISGDSMDTIEKAIESMKKGEVELVLINKANPVYALPESSNFKQALKKVPLVVSLSSSVTETSQASTYHLPLSHTYESWGDSNTRNGVYGLQQPSMAKLPTYNTMSEGDFFLKLAKASSLKGFETNTYLEYLKDSWKKVQKKINNNQSFSVFWKQSLQNGGVFKNFKPTSVKLQTNRLEKVKFSTVYSGLKLLAVNSVFHNANGYNGDKPWLLEVPDPLTQIAWDSWVEIHPKTAKSLNIQHGDEVSIKTRHGSSTLPAFVYHGIDENTLAIPTGLGRKIPFPSYSSRRGMITHSTKDLPNQLKDVQVGINAMSLFGFSVNSTSGDFSFVESGVEIKSTGNEAFVAAMDGQYRDDMHSYHADSIAGEGDRSQKDRGFIQTITLEDLKAGKKHSHGHHLKHRHYTTKTENTHSFYRSMPETVEKHPFGLKGNNTPKYYDPYKWEMSIDLDRCTGCSACVIACYAENNIPVVGKERSAFGREMSWLRIERYFDKNQETNELETHYSPEMCSQCGNAGCEPVCPVYAAYHNPDGLNAQVYNRCVGTRYCANNCIYKQRKFNWRTYEFPSPLNVQLNPDVTVREKGVMEKCTFCVQRIRYGKDIAKDEKREVFDGEIQTACQQSCPTNAITFGNIQDSNSAVSQSKDDSKKDYRGYHQLEEMNFKPSITYLKKVTHSKKG